jgi:hypothetical protein
MRLLTGVLAMPLGFVVLATCAGACGQVTGLSNDYVYDLQEDGGSATGDAKADTAATADGAMPDAGSDGSVGVDAATCSAAQAGSTELRLTQFNGSTGCKTCLADDCCMDVDTCLNISECRKAFACRLDCTTMTGTDRHTCFQTCNSNSGGNTTPMSYTIGVGACAVSKCSAATACAFL